MRNQKIYILAAALVVALCAVPAMAECTGNPGTISTIALVSDITQQSQVLTTAHQSDPNTYPYPGFGIINLAYTSAPLNNPGGSFWVMGGGDTATGSGVDNGALDVGAGVTYGFSGFNFSYAASFASSFGAGTGTDLCPAGGDCLCVLLTDHDAADSYAALVGAQVQSTLTTTLNAPAPDSVASGGYGEPIILRPLPRPSIMGTEKPFFDAVTMTGDDTVVDLTVTMNLGMGPAGGMYMRDGCNCGPVGYRILSQIIADSRETTDAPQDRTGGWTLAPLATGGQQMITAAGMPVTVRADCTGEDSVYLTAEVFFDSDFGTSVVSTNSLQVYCGTNATLANPDDKPVDLRPTLERPRRGGARKR